MKFESYGIVYLHFNFINHVIRLDPNPEYWEGKRGACAGAIQAIVANRPNGAPSNGVSEIISILRDSSNSQAESMIKTLRKFASNKN